MRPAIVGPSATEYTPKRNSQTLVTLVVPRADLTSRSR